MIPDKLVSINDLLIKSGTKLTWQRKALIRFLIDHPDEYFNTEEIYDRVRIMYPAIGRATIYRNMELYTGLRFVEKMTYESKITRYRLRRDEQQMLHNLLCLRCKKVKVVQADWAQEMSMQLLKEHGFSVLNHQLTFTGFFQNCNDEGCL
ncbi:Fur family transcriptional regulator [Paenibacillus albus]|uniref:Transcriptional repressor n=1 Tax=Paenibacillus albus TaxID=2495582 RepID=A0A3S9A5W7_9BACL|nr:transcriptional repressor [Paenibacillus albus]AZN41093.1 transcriptional repressor [Paenibacillus albus]